MHFKRYAITIQHEIVVYGYDSKQAKRVALNAYTKSKVIKCKELPPVEIEALANTIIDNRSAPGQ